MTDIERRLARIEIMHFARLDVRGADGQSRRAGIDQIEIDQFRQVVAQRLDRIIASLFCAQRNFLTHKSQRVGFEKRRYAAHHRAHRPQRTEQICKRPVKNLAMLDAAPEFAQLIKAVTRFIARNQCRIDRANRGSDHPIGFDPSFVQRLIDADLIGTERAAALEDQYRLTERCEFFIEIGGHESFLLIRH